MDAQVVSCSKHVIFIRLKRMAALIVMIAIACRIAIAAQPPPAPAASAASSVPRDPIEPTGDLKSLTLVRSGDGKAVIRFGKGPLRLITVGDRLGQHQAHVLEIAAGRLVVDDTFVGADGRPNRAQIILKDGDVGGKRFLARLEEPTPTGLQPRIVMSRSR